MVNSYTECIPLAYTSTDTQTVSYTSSAVQTTQIESEPLDADVGNFDGWMPTKDVEDFLNYVAPLMFQQLKNNLSSRAFDDYDKNDDALGDESVQCRYRLTYDWSKGSKGNASTNEAKYDDDSNGYINIALECTGVDWNSTGSTIAVSYGRTDHEGWCNHNAGVCIWNIFSRDFQEDTPSLILESSGCVQCVAFHPIHPALIAAGTFNGEVLLWNTANDSGVDPLIACSVVGEYSHREPVNSVSWIFNLKKRAYELASVSGDGKILIWNIENNLKHPIQGFLITNGKTKKSHNTSSATSTELLGGTAISFAGENQSAGTFVVGTEGGTLFRGYTMDTRNNNDYNNIESLLKSPMNENQWDTDTIEVLSRVASSGDVRELIRITERLVRHEDKNAKITPRVLFNSKPPLDKIYSNVSDFQFTSDAGAINALSCSPFHRNIFLSATSNGSIGLYSMLQPQAIEVKKQKQEYSNILRVQIQEREKVKQKTFKENELIRKSLLNEYENFKKTEVEKAKVKMETEIALKREQMEVLMHARVAQEREKAMRKKEELQEAKRLEEISRQDQLKKQKQVELLKSEMMRIKEENEKLLKEKVQAKLRAREEDLKLQQQYIRSEELKDETRRKKLEKQYQEITFKMNSVSNILKVKEDRAMEDEQKAGEHQRKRLEADRATQLKRIEDASKKNMDVKRFLLQQIQAKEEIKRNEKLKALSDAQEIAGEVRKALLKEQEKKMRNKAKIKQYSIELKKQIEEKQALQNVLDETPFEISHNIKALKSILSSPRPPSSVNSQKRVCDNSSDANTDTTKRTAKGSPALSSTAVRPLFGRRLIPSTLGAAPSSHYKGLKSSLVSL